MTWKAQQFDSNMTRKVDIPIPQRDETQHGKTIETRTLPMVLQIKTTAQRDSISNPLRGLMIFNTDTGRINIYNGHSWEEGLMSTTSSSSSVSSSSSSISTTTT